jgi:hypothetical protein
MKKQLLFTLLCAIMIGGLILTVTPHNVTAQSTNQGIIRVQSIDGGAVNYGRQWWDNETHQEVLVPPSNQTIAILSQVPKEGDVLIMAIGVQAQVSNSPAYSVNVSSISQEGVLWTRQIRNSYWGWMDSSVEIWLGIVGKNAASTITFNVAVNLTRGADYFAIAYGVCEYSGVATVSPLDQTAVSHDTKATTSTGITSLTSKPNELWVGAVFVESSVNQTVGLNGFSLVGGTIKGTDGRITTSLLDRVVDKKGQAWSGTEISADYTLVGFLGCIATFYGSDQSTDNPDATMTPNSLTSTGAKLQFSCQSTVSSTIRVNIKGNLTANGIGLPGEPVLFSYSINNAISWNDLTTINTDSAGGFTVQWAPSITGNYIVRAMWAGNPQYPAVNNTVNFAITPDDSGSNFAINSNSTLSTLSFDSAAKQLSISVSGPEGTTGYLEVYIPKSLMSDVSGLTVNIDGRTLDYASQSQNDAWLISFTYHHSTHQVIMNLNNPNTGINSFVGWILVATILIPLAIVLGAIAAQRNKVKHTVTKAVNK